MSSDEKKNKELEAKKKLAEKNHGRLERYSTYMKMRVEAKGKQSKTPITKDKEGNMLWLNRKQRRAMKLK